jgi:hypothetical protein
MLKRPKHSKNELVGPKEQEEFRLLDTRVSFSRYHVTLK